MHIRANLNHFNKVIVMAACTTYISLEYLQSPVSLIGYNNRAFAINRESVNAIKLSLIRSWPTKRGDVGSLRCEHTHMMRSILTDVHCVTAVDGYGPGRVQLLTVGFL